VSIVDDFFRDLDARWGAPMPAKVQLRIIGSSALMLQTNYERGTKDSDVLETRELTTPVRERLLLLAGTGSELHTKHKLHVEIVPSGTPFLSQNAVYHRQTSLNATLRHFDLEVLDVVDVVVAKLKRFNANDRSDIEAMIEKELVPHDRLVARFREAVDYYSGDARADDLPKYVRNLHTVERDVLGVPETEIGYPIGSVGKIANESSAASTSASASGDPRMVNVLRAGEDALAPHRAGPPCRCGAIRARG
jgi:hypothetical protein